MNRKKKRQIHNFLPFDLALGECRGVFGGSPVPFFIGHMLRDLPLFSFCWTLLYIIKHTIIMDNEECWEFKIL